MSGEGGWIKLHRRLAHHWIARDPERLSAWVLILLHVSHEPTTVVIDGQEIHLDRGQAAKSHQTWAQIFGPQWDRHRVMRLFRTLAQDGMITTKAHRRTTILTVCQYSTYQDPRTHDTGQRYTAHQNAHQIAHQNAHDKASNGKELEQMAHTRTHTRSHTRSHTDKKNTKKEEEGEGRACAPEAAAAASPAPEKTMDRILQDCGMAKDPGATAEVAGLLQAVLAAEQTPDTMSARESLLTELVTTARALGRVRVRWARDLDDAVEARRQQQEQRELAAIHRRIEESSADAAAEHERIDAWHRECLPEAKRLVAELDPETLDQRGREMLDLLRRTVESPRQRVGFALTSLQRHLGRPDPDDPDPDGPEGAPHQIVDPDAPLPPRAQAEVEREVRAARVEAGLEDDAKVNADLALAGDEDAGEDYAPHVDADAETQSHTRPDVPAENHDHDTVEIEPDGSIW